MRSIAVESSFAYLSTELEVLGGAENYYRWVLSRFAPYMGKRTIEVGAGIDTFSQSPLSCGQIAELVLIEPGDNLFPPSKNDFQGSAGQGFAGLSSRANDLSYGRSRGAGQRSRAHRRR
jgi:hypothetical protein